MTDESPRPPERRALVAVARLLGLSLAIGGVLIAAIIVALRENDHTPASDRQFTAYTSGCDPAATALPIALVGNSYSNDLDHMLEAVLCRSGIAPNVHVTVMPGGGSLADHVAAGDPARFAGNEIVVLQDQSQTPGLGPKYAEFTASYGALGPLGTAATNAGARVVLFQTWGHRDGDSGADTTATLAELYPDYARMQDLLIRGYDEYLAELRSGPAPDATVAPVGQAWRWVYEHDRRRFRSLYQSDGSHPTRAGTYVSALALAQQISGHEVPADVWAPPGIYTGDARLFAQAARSVYPS